MPAFALNTAFDIGGPLQICGYRLPTDPVTEQPCATASCCKCTSRLASRVGATCRCKPCERLKLLMRRYRSQPVFGILENKILIKPVLRALGLPFVEPIYAALADGPAGGWPRYSRAAIIKAILQRRGGLRDTVFKPATDGMGNHVEVFGSKSAASTNVGGSMATIHQQAEAIATRAEAAISHGGSRTPKYHQAHAHHGVLLEPRYTTHGQLRHVEYKAIVVFGVVVCVKAVRYCACVAYR